VIDAKRKGIAAMGVVRVITWRPCHLGRNPRRGGSLARESSIVAKASLVGEEREVRDVVFWVDRLRDRRESIIIKVVMM